MRSTYLCALAGLTLLISCTSRRIEISEHRSSLGIGAFDGGTNGGLDAGTGIVIPDEYLPDHDGTVGLLGDPDFGAAEPEVELSSDAGARASDAGEPTVDAALPQAPQNKSRAGGASGLFTPLSSGSPQPTLLSGSLSSSSVTVPIDVGIPPFRWEIETCSNSPPPASGTMLDVTVQAEGRAAGWELNNGGDRQPGATDSYYFFWPSAYAGPADKLESIKFDFRGGTWCMKSAKLYWYGQLYWSWSSTVTQPTGTYLHGHPTSGTITLDNNINTARASFVRFTNKTVSTKSAMCTNASNKRGFYFKTCDVNGAGTDYRLVVEVKHDGLIDFFTLPKADVDARGDVADVGRDNWCALRNLGYVKVYKRLGKSDWRICEVKYHGYWALLSTAEAAQPYWSDTTSRLLDDSLSPGGGLDAELPYDVGRVVDNECGSNCVTAKQGFALSLNSRVRACIAGTNPPDNSCNKVDEDCDGEKDEDYKPTRGVGACACNDTCVDGNPVACTPGTPVPERSSNRRDDNCNGTVDECVAEVCTDGYDNDCDTLKDCNPALSTCNLDSDCAVCGDGVVSEGAEEACDPALTAYCSGKCLPIDQPTRCESDAECPTGQRCGLGNGPRFGGASYQSFCWPINRCPGACGDVTAACGKCDCDATCSGALCGRRQLDGCGDVCEGSCGMGATGCLDNRDCPTGAVCMPSGTGMACVENPGYQLIDKGYFPPAVLPDGTECSEGPLCPEQPCDPGCNGVCNSKGECLSGSGYASCPATCPGACDVAGRCYTSGAAPVAPDTSKKPAPVNVVGELSGALDVGEDGAARYTVPLAAPPGRAGLQPELALTYSSRGGDGPLGLGWALTGVSAISVCDPAPSDDAVSADVLSPSLCLDGEPLRTLFSNAGNPRQSLVNEEIVYRPRFDAGYIVSGTVSTWEITDPR